MNLESINIARSANGRPSLSESENLGSIPGLAAKTTTGKVVFFCKSAKQSFAPGTRTDCRSTSAVALVDNPVLDIFLFIKIEVPLWYRNSSSEEIKNFEGETLWLAIT